MPWLTSTEWRIHEDGLFRVQIFVLVESFYNLGHHRGEAEHGNFLAALVRNLITKPENILAVRRHLRLGNKNNGLVHVAHVFYVKEHDQLVAQAFLAAPDFEVMPGAVLLEAFLYRIDDQGRRECRKAVAGRLVFGIKPLADELAIFTFLVQYVSP